MNSYRKLIGCATIACLLTTVSACSKQDDVKGTGNAKQETREVSAFSGINITGKYSIMGKIGSPQEFTISSNENILPHIKSSVDSGILVIADDDSVNVYPTVPQSIWFTAESISSISIDGASSFQLTGLNTDKLTIALAGAHTIYLEGKVGDLKLEANGSSNINAKDLTVDNAEIELNGSGVAGVSVKNNLKININGDGQVIYYNYQPKVEETVRGSGKIVNDGVPAAKEGLKMKKGEE